MAKTTTKKAGGLELVETDHEPKSGVKTTEFWMATVFMLIGPALMLMKAVGLIGSDVDTTQVESDLRVIIEQVSVLVSMIFSALVAMGYIKSRREVKVETARQNGMGKLLAIDPSIQD